ncbi:Lsr2 family protein [Nocardia sp. NPDC049190]|uniref:histone-like nucleoid-structuring protein Lsr2 n=1 Tax=Nocardia sp. NPDC049190 TaxID=3155650 RepID=UPI0033EA9B1A
MARKVVVEMVDDYDGQSPAEETVTFALDGVAYEIDLSVLNANNLRGVFEHWTPHARRIGRASRGKGGKGRSANSKEQTAAIRDWARGKGIEVSSRGRIAAEVVQQYNQESSAS